MKIGGVTHLGNMNIDSVLYVFILYWFVITSVYGY